MNGFRIDPQVFFAEAQWPCAQAALRRFETSSAARTLDTLTAASDSDRITAGDIVAVKLLGAEVPARASSWLLTDGADEVERGLAQIPIGATLWDDVHLARSGGPLDALFTLVQGRQHMDRETTSKLLATKRPHLVPIYEPRLAAVLYDDPERGDWDVWRARLRDTAGDELRERISIVNEAGRSVLFAAFVGIAAAVDRCHIEAFVTEAAMRKT